MHPVLIDLGFIQIHTYGVFVAFGVLAGIWTAVRLGRKHDIPSDFILDLAVKLLISGIIGSKALYLIIYAKEYISNPLDIIRDFRSGFVFLGGLILAFIVGYSHIKKNRYDIRVLFDVFAPALPLAHSFGRLGCTMAGCCYGKAVSHDAFYTIRFCNPLSVAEPKCLPLIATQPVSAIFLFILFIFLIFLFFRWEKRVTGSLFFIYLLLYSVFRFLIEFFRGDERGMFMGLYTSQIVSLLFFILSIFFLIRNYVKVKEH